MAKNLCTVLYLISLVISICGTTFVIAIHWTFLTAAKGIGSFSTLFVVEYVITSALLWLVRHLLQSRKMLDFIYCLATAIAELRVIVFPVPFYIE